MKVLLKFSPAFFLICIFFVISIGSALQESLTYDEIVHIQEGKTAILYHRFTVDTNNPPFERELAALPLVFHIDALMHSSLPNIRVFPARFVIIFFSVILGSILFVSAYRYFGLVSAYIALFLYTFDPNILANNHYVTFDIGFALFFFTSYVLFLEVLQPENEKENTSLAVRSKTIVLYIFLGISVGLGLSSKVSFIPFYALSAVIALIVKKRKKSLRFLWRKKYLVFLTLLVSFITLWGTYFFTTDVVIAKRSDASRVSAKLMRFAKSHNNTFLLTILTTLEHQKLPLGNYIAMVKNNMIRNSLADTYFFFGRFYKRHTWYFMLGNIFVKTPLPQLVLFSIGIWVSIRKGSYHFTIPVLAILVITSVANLSPWLRYTLPMYPFISLIAGASYTFFKTRFSLCLLSILGLWYFLGTLYFYPHFISYTNELLGYNPKKDLLLIDSNNDWGQAIPDLVVFTKREKPRAIRFSYFGRDRADLYGLKSNTSFGSYKFADICAFHLINKKKRGQELTAISISNWYYCGYATRKEYTTKRIKTIIAHAILIF